MDKAESQEFQAGEAQLCITEYRKEQQAGVSSPISIPDEFYLHCKTQPKGKVLPTMTSPSLQHPVFGSVSPSIPGG